MSTKTFQPTDNAATGNAAECRTVTTESAPLNVAPVQAPAPSIGKDAFRLIAQCCGCLAAPLALDVKSAIGDVLRVEIAELVNFINGAPGSGLPQGDGREEARAAGSELLRLAQAALAAVEALDPFPVLGLLAAIERYTLDTDWNAERRMIKAYSQMTRQSAGLATICSD